MEPGWFKSALASLLQKSPISDFCITVYQLKNKKKIKNSENGQEMHAHQLIIKIIRGKLMFSNECHLFLVMIFHIL